MATTIGFLEREEMIKLYETGISMLKISKEISVNYGTVKTLIKRYKTEGLAGIVPKYNQCGLRRSHESECSYRLVRFYKHYHPQWGVSYILMKIKEKYPKLPLCVSRVYERRLKAAHFVTLSKNPPLQSVYHPEASRLPHDTWQIDAKERLITLDGQSACYLTVSDEKTGCLLETNVFSLRSY